eukprot:556353_1
MFPATSHAFRYFLCLFFGLMIMTCMLKSPDHIFQTIVENDQNINLSSINQDLKSKIKQIQDDTVVGGSNITKQNETEAKLLSNTQESQFKTDKIKINQLNNPITIVTAFFQIGEKSKNTMKQYEEWIPDFLNRVKCPIVIFTNVQDYISQQIHNEQYPTLIVNLSLSDLFVYKKYYSTYQKHHEIDPEFEHHSPELYVIWTSKAHFLYRVSNILNPFNSTYFFWVDVGSFRVHDHHPSAIVLNSSWPDYNRVLYAFSECRPDDKCIILGLVNKFDLKKELRSMKPKRVTERCPLFKDHVQGGIIAGTSEAIHWYYKEYFMTHDAWIRENIFVGKEQNVMNAVVLRNSQQHVLLLNSTLLPGLARWLNFQVYFANTNILYTHTHTHTHTIAKPTYLNNIYQDNYISSLTTYYNSIPQC